MSLDRDILVGILDIIYEELPSERDKEVFSEAVKNAHTEIATLLTMLADMDKKGDNRVLH
tara:strand:- start:613 stop:792 length:180 start_codon:yes stop_codon:yes gene_type:complete